MLEDKRSSSFITYEQATFNVDDIITLNIEFDETIEDHILIIHLNGRQIPLIFLTNVNVMFCFLSDLLKAKDITEIIARGQERQDGSDAASRPANTTSTDDKHTPVQPAYNEEEEAALDRLIFGDSKPDPR